MQSDWLLPAVVLLPLAAVPVAVMAAAVRRMPRWLGPALLAVQALLCLLLEAAVAGGTRFSIPLAASHLPGVDLELRLAVDGLGALFLLLTALAGLAAEIVLVTSGDRLSRSRYQLPLTLLALGVLAGAFTSANLITLYAFWQLAVFASALLLATRLHGASLRAAGRFLVLGQLGAVCVFFAASLAQTYGGNRTLVGWYQEGDPPFRLAMLLLLTVAAVIAAGAPPLHSGMGPVLGTLEAAIVPFWLGVQNKLGLYLLARVCLAALGGAQAREWSAFLAVLGALAIAVGSINALAQRQARQLVGYVLLAQTGYAFLGLGTGEGLGVAGALFHVFAQTLAAAATMLALATVRDSVGSEDPTLVGGLAQRLPLAALVFLVGTLGLVGMPPWGGFVGLLLIYHGLAASGEAWRLALIAVGVVGSLATGVALTRLGGGIFLGVRLPEQPFANLPTVRARVGLWLVLLACLAVGLLPRLVLDPTVAPLVGWKVVGNWVDLAVAVAPGAAPVGLWNPIWAGLLLALPFAAVAVAARFERANPYPVLPAERTEVLGLARALSPGEPLNLAPEGEQLRSERWWRTWQAWRGTDYLDVYRLIRLPVAVSARVMAGAARLTFRLLLR